KHAPNYKTETERIKRELMEQWMLDYFFSSSGDHYERLYKDELIDESFDYQSTMEEKFHFTLFSSNTENPDSLQQQLQSMFQQIKRYKWQEPELERMRRKWIGEYVIELDSLEHIANEV